MAICINCHTMDKGFFAPRCHACNEECGFLEQVLASTIYNTVYIGGMIGVFYFILWLIFG